MNNIIFVIVDAGSGHRSVASAIEYEINKHKSIKISSQIVDFYHTLNIRSLRYLSFFYKYLTTGCLPVYNFFYKITNHIFVVKFLAFIFYKLNKKTIIKFIKKTNPKIIIVANPSLIGHLFSYVRSDCKFDFQLITLVTDPVTFHKSWITPKTDLFIVTTEKAFDKILNYYPNDQIKLVNFPVHRCFFENNLSKIHARNLLDIDKSKFTILVTGGGFGAGFSISLIKHLETSFPDYQFLCVTGSNEKKYKKLKKQLSKNSYTFGFINQMNILMAASDIIISKAGPSTIYECIAMNRPLIVNKIVGQQEIGNLEIIQEYSQGWYCQSNNEITNTIKKIHDKLDNPLDNINFNSTISRKIGSNQISEIIISRMSKSLIDSQV